MEKFQVFKSTVAFTSLIVAFVQKVYYNYYDELLRQIDAFFVNWFDFSIQPSQNESWGLLNKRQMAILTLQHDDEAVSLCMDGTDEPKVGQSSVWEKKNALEAARKQSVGSLSSKTQANLFSKITQMVPSGNGVESVQYASNVCENGDNINNLNNNVGKGSGKKVKEVIYAKRPCKKDFIPGTTVKLDEYNKSNQDFMMKKREGSSDDEYVFLHPECQRNLYLKAFSFKNPLAKNSKKKKVAYFKPTELSVIFENLAY